MELARDLEWLDRQELWLRPIVAAALDVETTRGVTAAAHGAEPLSSSPLFDDPERRRRAVKALLVLSPFAFVGCYLLAAVQGAAPWHALLIATIMLVGCLGAAALLRLRGSHAGKDVFWLKLILALLARR